MKEYRSLLEHEYGKEKKKHVYESMYGEISASERFHSLPGAFVPPIKLNLRPELKKSPRFNKNTHYKLQTISPDREITERFVRIDPESIEQSRDQLHHYSTKQSQFTMTNKELEREYLHRSGSIWKNKPVTFQKPIYLFPTGNLPGGPNRHSTRNN